MEGPTSASLGAMGSLLGKLEVLLAPGRRLPKGVKDGIHLLKDDLEEASAYLEELSEVEDPPVTAKCWMNELRELSYDMEDCIDSCSVRPARANIKTRSARKMSHVKIFRLPKRLKWHQQIAYTVSEFRMYVRGAIERHDRYGLHSCCTSRRRFVSVGPMLPTPHQETADLVLIDGRMSEIINSVANDGDQQRKVVSLLGSACLGKTTLATVLYNKFGGQFDCRAFIQVSRKPDMKRLFYDMLSQVRRHQAPDDCKEIDLVLNIRRHLRDKRYLIIVDDLWAASVWDIISHAFPEDSQRSRIIVTTRVEDVALSCCCYRSEYVFEMKHLDDYHSRKLFFNRLFGSESDCPQEFKEVSSEIVEICGGLALVTINIASLLASQPAILMDLLVYIRDMLRSCLWTNSTSEGMRQVLNLSYNNLPHYLKTCLLYLNMYQEGSTIYKGDLVKQWMAEGFIDTREGRDMAKVAASYFDELIQRRFIQPIDINYNDEVLSCTVHDMVRDLIAYKSVEENFILVVDNYRKNVVLSDKVRRLSLCFGDAKYGKTPGNIRTSQVRSLTFFGLYKCMPSITEFKLLRVLSLQLSGHCSNDTLDLTGISELFQLRYLKVVCDVCIELPENMRGLQCLETLDMDTKVTAVPWDIIHLPRLLHLNLPVDTNLLDWIGSMRSVSLWSLGKMKDLQDIHLTCSTPPSDHLGKNMEALGSILGGHGSLKTLALVPGSSHKKVVVHGASKVIVSWDGLAPPLLLQRFEWLPHSCIFSRVPKWIGELGNLCILKIAVKELLTNNVDILRGLPALTALSLYVQTAPVRIVFGKAGFSVLKYFKFRCSVPWLKFEADAMPNLRKLKLGFNAPGVDQHGNAPISIEHLSGLKEISAKIGGASSDAESALKRTISNHPNNPRINVQLVDCILYGNTNMGTEEKEYGIQDDVKRKDKKKQADSRISTLPESSLHLSIPELKPAIVIEDAMVSASTGAMNSLLTKLATLMGDGYGKLVGMQKEVMILKQEIDAMSALLEQLADMAELTMQMQDLRNQMREMTYDIENCIDSLMLDFDKDMHEGTEYPDKWDVLQTFIHQIQNLTAQAVKADLRSMVHMSEISYMVTESQSPTAYDKTIGLVGIDGPRDKLVRKMIGGKQQLQVACILGYRGLGKTTLATEVYNKIKWRFERQVFIPVPQKMDITRLHKSILSILCGIQVSDCDTVESLIKKTTGHLQHKRYLIVFDGVWSGQTWEVIKHAFPENNHGSRIIMTTTSSHLAVSFVSHFSGFMHRMEPLPDQDSLSLFRSIIFGSEENIPGALGKVADVILKTCGGIPLAIIIIAGLLASKPAEVEMWEMVGKRMEPVANGDLTTEERVRKIFHICYSELPRHMRTCLLYLSVFTENHVISKDRLIWRWIAEGFLPKRSEESWWETGESYFVALIFRNLIEAVYNENEEKDDEVPIGYAEVPMGCKVHGLISEFITSLSNQENFVTSDAEATHVQHRRLTVSCSYRNQGNDGASRLRNKHLSKLRSITISGGDQGMDAVSLFRMPFGLGLRFLRVVDLEGTKYLRSHHLEGIEGLVLLKYLGLKGTGVGRLPEGIGQLQHLETLDLRHTNLWTWPASIVGLQKLVRLLIDRSAQLPSQIWKLQELEELSTVDVNSLLAELVVKSKRLRMLGISVGGLTSPQTVSSFLKVLRNSNLQSLSLYYCHGDDGLLDLLLDSWEIPRRQLRRFELTISGPIFVGVPPRMASLVNLTHLHIGVTKVEAEGLRVLGDLPNLLLLKLYSEASARRRCIINGDVFRCLKVFWFTCHFGAMGLEFTPGAMPQLRRLRLSFKATETWLYGNLDFGIQHLTCLVRVHAIINCEDAGVSDVNAAEAAIRKQASRNPNKPTVELSRGLQHRLAKSQGQMSMQHTQK